MGDRALLGIILSVGSLLAFGLSEHEMEELGKMQPQQQAERLLERTINHYSGAREELARRIESWTGHLESTQTLNNLSNTAYFSNDLKVREAALRIWMAQYGLHRTKTSVDEMVQLASVHPERRYYALSNLGILGNQGVERELVFRTLRMYLSDPDSATRSGAINGLGLLGTEETIEPLLATFRSDSSYDLRERAACNLADSGLLSRELRQKAVPELIRFLQDPAVDQTTRKWVYQALTEITQQNLGQDASAWVSWYGRSRN